MPDLVAEVVSPSTEDWDPRRKKQILPVTASRSTGIVDRAAEEVEIHRLDGDAALYRRSEHLRPSDRATSPLLPDLALDVTRLFRD